MVYTSDELYRKPNVSDEWQQGDIIEGLYITRVIEDDMLIRRPQDLDLPFAKISYIAQLAERNNKVIAPFSNRYSREYALIPVFKTDVMVVSQTCDIAQGDQVTVARVRLFLDSDKPEFLENIRHGNIFRAFHLPDYPANGEESFSALAELTVLNKKLLEVHKKQRRKSLSPEGLRGFQFFIERFFGREAMPDNVSRIITEFCRRLRETETGDKIERIYYDYSAGQISLLVALNEEDDNVQAAVETARNLAADSIEHSYELSAAHQLVDNISLRDIEGFREFR